MALPRKILVVDDEPELCELLSMQLEMEGFAILKADGGNEAFRLFLAETIDLIISDIRMPKGSGIDLLKQVRQSAKAHVPVILMTGFSDTKPEEAMRLGASALLTKPFTFELLAEKIHVLLRKSGTSHGAVPKV